MVIIVVVVVLTADDCGGCDGGAVCGGTADDCCGGDGCGGAADDCSSGGGVCGGTVLLSVAKQKPQACLGCRQGACSNLNSELVQGRIQECYRLNLIREAKSWRIPLFSHKKWQQASE